MKKSVLFLGAMLLATSAFAHEHFLYTQKLDVSGQNSIKMKAILGHPGEGKEANPISIATIDGKSHLPKEFFVVHNGEKTNLLSKAKLGTLKTDVGTVVAIDATYGLEDGLKGSGSWVFVMDSGQTKDEGYTFNPVMKLIVTKDGGGSDYMKRVAEGHNEIVPLVNPVNAWKENVFRAKFVDKNGNPIKNARIDASFINANFNVANDTWKGGDKMPKTSVRVFTDDNGVFAFTPSRAGHWVIRAVESLDREKKKMRERDGEARGMQSSNETRDKAIT